MIARARNELERDKVQAEQLKIDVRTQLKYAEVASVTLESARQSDTNARLVQFLSPYFRSVLESLELRANDYKRDVDEVRRPRAPYSLCTAVAAHGRSNVLATENFLF